MGYHPTPKHRMTNQEGKEREGQTKQRREKVNKFICRSHGHDRIRGLRELACLSHLVLKTEATKKELIWPKRLTLNQPELP